LYHIKAVKSIDFAPIVEISGKGVALGNTLDAYFHPLP